MYRVYDNMHCPLCGGKVQHTDRAWGCTNWKEADGSCRFTIWNEFNGHTWSEEEVEAFIHGAEVGPVELISRTKNTPYRAYVRYDKETNKLIMRFADDYGKGDDREKKMLEHADKTFDVLPDGAAVADDADDIPFGDDNELPFK